MLHSSSWKTLAKGIPKQNNEQRRNVQNALDASVASAGVGENAGKRGAGLPDEEACSDEDDDEDD